MGRVCKCFRLIVANMLEFRDGYRVESSRARVEHRTGLSCSKLEILEFDRVEHRSNIDRTVVKIESNKVSGVFDSIFRTRNSCSTRFESSRVESNFEHARSKSQVWLMILQLLVETLNQKDQDLHQDQLATET